MRDGAHECSRRFRWVIVRIVRASLWVLPAGVVGAAEGRCYNAPLFTTLEPPDGYPWAIVWPRRSRVISRISIFGKL